VKADELITFLQAFYRDKRGLLDRHVAGAARVGQYDVNNTYQYIIAREDVQLEWLRQAIEELAGQLPTDGENYPLPDAGRDGAESVIVSDDARLAQAFVDRWRDRVESVTNARHRGMLRVILGETLEHKRFFEQAVAGRRDLLGRHSDGVETTGRVLPTRWIE
jgi:hypothetical protein